MFRPGPAPSPLATPITSSNGAKAILAPVPRLHNGPLDKTLVTTVVPSVTMASVCAVLKSMGLEVQMETDFKFRCVRARRRKTGGAGDGAGVAAFNMAGSAALNGPIYGAAAQDGGDEVRFSVELTRLDGLKDTYALDIRRLKGRLRTYQFLYDSVRT
ncbi:hypothetical protein BDV98DRAFT_518140 [Pterulicium gracile]|uniref:non-specific serine/threonine protein kinase n=1 Tax=Pterulicium gracile TaxID=1884261 RepID=A0A5C3PZE2_9AGAR|nr:hypothetical protein BDV98DRAFT_518140 [Pterula gracilis]